MYGWTKYGCNNYYKRPNMLAFFFKKRTKYACNDNINEDLIWMQSQFRRGLNMLAISNKNGLFRLAIIS